MSKKYWNTNIFQCSMFNESTIMLVQIFDKFRPFHFSGKSQFLFLQHFTVRLISFTNIFEVHFQRISYIFP